MTDVRLAEWTTLGPDADCLRSRELTTDARLWAERLCNGRVLDVVELRRGLQVRTFAHVGRVRLGDLTVTVEPKLAPELLLGLLQYAFGLRNLRLLGDARFGGTSSMLEDLVIHQLHAEVRELLSAGLHRRYRQEHQELAVPRGRLDTRRLARALSLASSRLPCEEHPRSYDHALNQALLAGLTLAADLCSSPALLMAVRRLAGELAEVVTRIPLDSALLERARRSLSRMTRAYESVLSLIQVLHESTSAALDDDGTTVRLPGFLFDMNRFFEALVGRFLREHAPSVVVHEQEHLGGLMRYVPGHNPRQRRAPTPRPDFVLTRGSQVAAVLDAKYRDLWDHELPREMLYQLALYALSQGGGFTAAMVYPCHNPLAREAIVDIRTAVAAAGATRVALRPLRLSELLRALELEEDGRPQMIRELVGRLVAGDQRARLPRTASHVHASLLVPR